MVKCYTNEDYAKAYAEVLEILKHFPENYIQKLPKDIIQMYEDKQNNNYYFSYDENLELDEQNISKLATILIANLYIEYILNDEERKDIKEKDKKELEQLELEKKKRYNSDNLFKDKKYKKVEKEEESLVVIKKKSIFEKIIEKIKQIKLDIKQLL